MVAAGTVIAGKYRLERPIGKGGMGWVWRAQQVDWNAPVAVKLINPDMARGEPQVAAHDKVTPVLARFFSEARAAAAIRSPHVVQILDHGIDPILHTPFIVTELLEGETLAERLERTPRLDFATTATILTHVARALTRMHQAHMVHRDLKPSNVFLVANDEELIAKVLDFGIAKTRSPVPVGTPITATGQQVGTPYYMSPDQIRGRRDIDFRSDIWALGVMAFECLTGSRPFAGQTMGQLTLQICVEPLPRPSDFVDVPRELDAWFLRCVDRDRARTFSSAKQAVDALRAVLTPSVRPSSAGFPVSAGSRRTEAVEDRLSTGPLGLSRGVNATPTLRSQLVLLAMGMGFTALAMWALVGSGVTPPKPTDSTTQGTTTLVDVPPQPLAMSVEHAGSATVSIESSGAPKTVPPPATSAERATTPEQVSTLEPATTPEQAATKRTTNPKPRTKPQRAPKPAPAATFGDLIEERL